MFKVNDIIELRYISDDNEKTEKLKSKFKKLKQIRKPMFLTLEEFDEVLRWKLRNQYRRQIKLRKENTDKVVREVTRVALSIKHDNKEYETELRIGLLRALRGVDVPVASAILALVIPHEFCVIDYRGWRQVFGQNKNNFSPKNYKQYLAKIREIAADIGWSVQEVDLAVWELDRRKHSI